MLYLCTVNKCLFKVCFSHLVEMPYSCCVGQFLEISSTTVAYAVTGKRVNRGGGCEMAKWTSCERKRDN